MMKQLALALGLLSSPAALAEPAAPVKAASALSVSVKNPELRVTPNGAGALYLVLESSSDTLVGAEAPKGHASLHETLLVKDVARMVEAKSFPIPPRGTLTLAPGGKHVMIMGLDGVKEGEELTITLKLASGQRLPVRVVVRTMGKQ